MGKQPLSAALMGGIILATAVSAQAGGFNRGAANLDPLYNAGGFGIYSTAIYVSPGRSYSSVNSPVTGPSGSVEFGEDYWIPSVSVGGRIAGGLSCAGSYTQPYGADAKYSGPITFHIAEQSLETHEYGLTCAYGFDVGKGRLSVIGGGFYETVEFTQGRNFIGIIPGVTDISLLQVESDTFGYRLGLGYDIPEIALKAQLLYRSETNHDDATGNYTNTPFAALAVLTGAPPAVAGALYGTATSATARTGASLPQSLELNLQSGIAPGWLAFGSVKWTDWSVLQNLIVTEGVAGRPFSSTQFFFKDGWTINGGIGHQFNEKLAGQVSLTWDKGVSTGWDTLYDTWTIAGGLGYNATDKFQLRAGAAAIYFEDGLKDQRSSATDYTAVSPSEWGYALQIGATLKF